MVLLVVGPFAKITGPLGENGKKNFLIIIYIIIHLSYVLRTKVFK